MPESFSTLLGDFYTFLQYPRRDIIRERMSFSRFGQIVGLHYLILIPVMVIMSVLSGLIGLEDLDHSIDDLMADSSMLWFAFLLVIAAPVLEELLFRFPLRYRRGSIFILIFIATVFSYYIGSAQLPPMHELLPAESVSEMEQMGSDISVSALLLAFMTFSLGAFILLLLSFSKSLLAQSSGYIRAIYPHIFFLTAMIFGFVHISNFSGDVQWYAIPILVLPQASMGLLLGYIRLRYGMLSNILLHAVNNFVPAVLLIGSQAATSI